MSRRLILALLAGDPPPPAPGITLPPGMEIHHQPSGLITSGGFVSGWRNEVTGAVVPVANGTPGFIAADPAFFGHSSVRVNQVHRLGGQPLGYVRTDGISIFQVIKLLPNTGAPDQNHDGCMPWFMDTVSGPIDVWTGVNRAGWGINTFQSNLYGADPAPTPPARFATQLLTTTAVNGNAYGGGVFLNGTRISSLPQLGGPVITFKGILYPGNVASYLNYSFDGYMAEFIAYPRVLNDAELTQVNAYLMAKYGL